MLRPTPGMAARFSLELLMQFVGAICWIVGGTSSQTPHKSMTLFPPVNKDKKLVPRGDLNSWLFYAKPTYGCFLTTICVSFYFVNGLLPRRETFDSPPKQNLTVRSVNQTDDSSSTANDRNPEDGLQRPTGLTGSQPATQCIVGTTRSK